MHLRMNCTDKHYQCQYRYTIFFFRSEMVLTQIQTWHDKAFTLLKKQFTYTHSQNWASLHPDSFPGKLGLILSPNQRDSGKNIEIYWNIALCRLMNVLRWLCDKVSESLLLNKEGSEVLIFSTNSHFWVIYEFLLVKLNTKND